MRIEIKEEKIRTLFFESLKNNFENSWKKVRVYFNIPRTTFDKYRTRGLLIPEELFLKMIDTLNNITKEIILDNINKFPDNFGQIEGGKKAYLINIEKFKEGRKKGIASFKYSKKLDLEELYCSFSSVKLTPQICEVIGAFIGDGCFNCYKNKLYQIEFAGDSRKDLFYYNEIIIPAIKSIIPDICPHIYNLNLTIEISQI